MPSFPHTIVFWWSLGCVFSAPLVEAIIMPRKRASQMGVVEDAPHPARTLITGMSKTSKSLERNEDRSLNCIAEVAKSIAVSSTARLIAEAEDEPLLQTCSSDATPIAVSMEAQAQLPSGSVMRRGGKECHNFLVAAQFTRSPRPYTRQVDAGRHQSGRWFYGWSDSRCRGR